MNRVPSVRVHVHFWENYQLNWINPEKAANNALVSFPFLLACRCMQPPCFAGWGKSMDTMQFDSFYWWRGKRVKGPVSKQNRRVLDTENQRQEETFWLPRRPTTHAVGPLSINIHRHEQGRRRYFPLSRLWQCHFAAASLGCNSVCRGGGGRVCEAKLFVTHAGLALWLSAP